MEVTRNSSSIIPSSRSYSHTMLDNETHPPAWTELRDRWEYSHVARAVLALISLIAIVVAVACGT